MLDLIIKNSKDIDEVTIEEVLELNKKGYFLLVEDGRIKAITREG